jgi:hypothetical protein
MIRGIMGLARAPFAEAEIGGDDDAGLLVKLGEQMEQQRAALSNCERIGTDASNGGAPCSIRSLTAPAIPYILRSRSMTTIAALAFLAWLMPPA